jgi:hypothetical protein
VCQFSIITNMHIQPILTRLLATARGLHTPRIGVGYDMLFYPAFEFYYSVVLRKHYPQIRNILFEYKLDSKQFAITNEKDLEQKRMLGKTGTYLKALPQNEHFRKELLNSYENTRFHVSEDMSNYLAEYGVHIDANYNLPTYFLKSSPFGKFYDCLIHYLVDDQPSFLNTYDLNAVSFEEVFESGAKNKPELHFNILPQNLITLATLLSIEIDRHSIANDLAPFKESEYLDAELLETISYSLSDNSKFLFENFFGMKILFDTLNPF